MTTRRALAIVGLATTVTTVAVPLVAPRSGRADTASRTFAGSLQLDYLAIPTEARARAFTLDGATVELSMKLSADLSPSTSVSVKVCFACHGFEAGMAFVELRASDELHLRVGRMTPSFGNFPLRHDPANHRTSDKPLPYDMGRMLRRDEWNEGVLPAPWVDNGIEVGGTHFFEHGQIDYAAFLMSGPKAASEAADFDFIASRSPGQYYVDNNSQPMVGGRVAGSFELGDYGTLELGGSVMAGRYDNDAKLEFAIAGVESVLDLHAIVLRAEYLIRWTQMALGDDPATRFKFGPNSSGKFDDYFLKDGFYVEGEIPIGPIDLIGRWDGLRRVGNVLAGSPLSGNSSIYRLTGGGAVKFGNLRVKASVEAYRFTDFDNEIAVHLGMATPF
jgi:hypothetical protein